MKINNIEVPLNLQNEVISLLKTIRMKSKGEKHAKGSKPKIEKPVDNEKIREYIALVEQITPVWRLDQMLEKACDFMNGGQLDRTKLASFIRLVFADIEKEESLILQEKNIDIKKLNKHISQVCKKYFFEREKDLAGI